MCVCVRACVCLSVTKLTGLCIANKEPLVFLWHFQRMHYVDFVENAFKFLLPSSLLGTHNVIQL